MCIIVIAGGPNKDLAPLLSKITSAEKVICADSGADALHEVNILPDVVWGDMDSISRDTLEWLKQNNVAHRLFPIEKDMTDSELCLRSLEKNTPILFVTSLVGRTDHVMTNLLLVMRLHTEGYDITVTDGHSWVYPLCGEKSFEVPSELVSGENVCSLIPVGEGAYGVSAYGMKYPLSENDISWGSSFTVSNEFDLSKEKHGFVMRNGTMLVMIVPRS